MHIYGLHDPWYMTLILLNIMSLDIDITCIIYECHFPVAEQRYDFSSAALSCLILKYTMSFYQWMFLC